MRAYQGIFARFTLSSSASSASDFFFRPRPRNPILLFNLSCFFWWLVFLLFLRRKILPSLFAFFQADEKAEKATRRNFNAKICIFRRERHKKTKRGKKERQDKTLFFILFFYISSRKERVHTTQQQHKHARFREVKRER